eukprot:TRINITY_DN6754_c0_g2_i2.p1 TRINITY_DN6754_c0_g2~~TRINITY_DN6754_c0_g2_i2.p1  ORF type:complete len:103 (-),score=13.90 TRINITY_DN6754_c0_g2_i2:1028-1336(-)
MSRFSGAVTVDTLDDFISPSQECIKPVEVKKDDKTVARIEIGQEGGPSLQINTDGSTQELKKAEITLQDCLACSGCVTSAETILIEQQSHHEFLEVLKVGVA